MGAVIDHRPAPGHVCAAPMWTLRFPPGRTVTEDTTPTWQPLDPADPHPGTTRPAGAEGATWACDECGRVWQVTVEAQRYRYGYSPARVRWRRAGWRARRRHLRAARG